MYSKVSSVAPSVSHSIHDGHKPSYAGDMPKMAATFSVPQAPPPSSATPSLSSCSTVNSNTKSSYPHIFCWSLITVRCVFNAHLIYWTAQQPRRLLQPSGQWAEGGADWETVFLGHTRDKDYLQPRG